MIYLSSFTFPDADQEFDFRHDRVKRKCYDTVYPFHVLSARHLQRLDFEPLTILYGGNGSGKTTAINVMAEKLGLQRDTLYNRSNFFEDYTDMCSYSARGDIPEGSRVITSDDVFEFMLNLRALNEGIDRHRDELLEQYLIDKRDHNFRLRSMDDYDTLRRINNARRLTQSKYVRAEGVDNVRERSNGESALEYFMSRVGENALYMLDEPENSLSPARQLELTAFIQDSVRFFGCQFVISTHSPFVLGLKDAKIYDLDSDPVCVRRWTDLPNVRTYYDFFRERKREFEDRD